MCSIIFNRLKLGQSFLNITKNFYIQEFLCSMLTEKWFFLNKCEHNFSHSGCYNLLNELRALQRHACYIAHFINLLYLFNNVQDYYINMPWNRINLKLCWKNNLNDHITFIQERLTLVKVKISWQDNRIQ